MYKLSLYLTLLSAVFFADATRLVAQSDKNYSKEVQEKINEVENSLGTWVKIKGAQPWNIADRMKYSGVKGLSIAVVSNYKIEWVKAYGLADTAGKRPVTPQTLFQAASVSKSLNAIGVLRLVRDKKLDLYADINNYLTSWKFPYDSLAKGKKISIANLLSHTGGLTVHGFAGYEAGKSLPTIAQVLNGTRPANSGKVRSMYQPGLKFEYSGGGTTITQLIITDQTGKAYDDYMWQNVLKPLGMTSSSYAQPPAENKKQLLATGYREGGAEIKGKYHIYPEQAPAGLWTNPTDLAKYIIETQLSLRGKSSKVLSQSDTRLRLTPYIDKSAALGVFIVQKGTDSYFSHGGANEGFRSQYFGSMEGGNGVVVMVNSDNGSIMDEVINSVAVVYGWKDFYKPVVKDTIAVARAKMDEYAGKYVTGNFSLRFFKKNGSLWFKQGAFETPLYFTTDTDCFIFENPNMMKFSKNAEGKATFGVPADKLVLTKAD